MFHLFDIPLGAEICIGIPHPNMPASWLACVPNDDRTKIFFNPNLLPDQQKYVEDNILEIIIHENLHQVIWKVESSETSRGFDLFFGDDRKKKLEFCKELLE